MAMVIGMTRWFRLILITLIVFGVGTYLVVRAGHSAAPPDAKAAESPPAPSSNDPPIVLPNDMELDPETNSFAVIQAKCIGKVKWLVHCDGCEKVQTFAHPSAPILIVGIPKSGFVLVTAITATKDEPYSAQVRVRSKGSESSSSAPAPKLVNPSQKVDVNLIYDVDKKSPELDAILSDPRFNWNKAEKGADGHSYHAYDYRSETAVRRKLTEIITKPGGGGVPSLIILDQAGHLLPEGRPLQVPTTADNLVNLIRKVAG